MAEGTTTTTAVPHKHEGGFPPFDTTTFPSQIFWLVITFARANTLAEESRKVINSEIEKARHDADAMAAAEIDKAESRIAASRGEARTHVANAARDAAVAIVARLTGETVTADEAAAAVRTATGG